MTDETEFGPRIGRLGAKGPKEGRSYLGRVLSVGNLARGGRAVTARSSGFTGARIGRGSAIGRLLASRGDHAAFHHRRVIVKMRIVRLAGQSMEAAKAHLRYIQREGVTRDGQPGQLYHAGDDEADGKAFLVRGDGDRHHFRFIVSPEDGADYDDLQMLTKRLMAQMAEDLHTRLDWVAVDHFDTGHPHSHILLRGKDDCGGDLIIAPEYVTIGVRERAAELVALDLGPRIDDGIGALQRAEMAKERLTSIDQRLSEECGDDRIVTARAADPFEQTLRAGRLGKLGRLGLAHNLGGGQWRLNDDLEETLHRMGERGDNIRILQRTVAADSMATPAALDLAIYDPSAASARPLVGRILARGLSDEQDERHHLVVEAIDGRSHFVDIGKGAQIYDAQSASSTTLAPGAIVRIEPVSVEICSADRTIADVAALHGGRYDVETHLRHDPTATARFAQTHVRRLEAMARLTGNVARNPDGSWTIAPDHCGRAAAYERARAQDRPVIVTLLSHQPLETLIAADGATWLDRESLAAHPASLRDAGFGREVRDAQDRRRQWLVAQGLAEQDRDTVRYRSDLLLVLERREMVKVAGQLSEALGLRYVETANGGPVDGVLRGPVDLVSGRFALIEKTHEFTLVPWRPTLDHHVGKSVSGIMRDLGVDWTIDRGRGGPHIS